MGFTMIESSAWAALMVAIITFAFQKLVGKKWKNLPPGPNGLPIIGYLHKLCAKPIHTIMNELSTQYGDVFCMFLGSRLTVVLNSKEAIYEALIKKAKSFSGRPDLATFNRTRHGCAGISMCDYNEAYIRNRHMSVKAMHRLCADGSFINKVFCEEIEKMNNWFNTFASTNHVFNPLEEFYKVIPSVVVNFIFGKNLEYDDKDIVELVDFNRRWFESAESNNPADFFKILEKFPNKRLKAIEDSGQAFYGYILKRMADHVEGTTGLLQHYLDLCKEQFNKDDPNSNFSFSLMSEREKLELARVVADMLGGAFDTVALSLGWALIYLADKDEIIAKCRTELNTVFKNKNVTYDQHKQLPYFRATIYEILRLSTVAPMGLPRSTTEDIKLRNFTIPKNTMVFPNLWQANRDESVWKNPHELDPEHFLKETGEIDSIALRRLSSFSYGVRRCPGESFALAELFVLLGTFIKTFNYKIIDQPKDKEPSNGLTSQPKPYTISISRVEENNNI